MRVIENYIRPLLSVRSVTTIELVEVGGATLYRLVSMKKDAKGIHFKHQEVYSSIDELPQEFVAKSPVVLILDAHTVHKIKALEKDLSIEDTLRKVIPNADEKDFYVQRLFQLKVNKEIVSLYRVGALKQLLKEFSTYGILISEVLLGSFHIQKLYSDLQVEGNSILLPNYTFQFEQREIINFESTSNEAVEYKLGEETIANHFLSATTACINFLMIGYQGTTFPILIRNQKEQQFKQWFAPTLYLGVGLIFLGLLVNFLLFSSYYQKSLVLDEKLASISENNKVYEEIRQEISAKEEFLTSRIPNQFFLSFYADRIGHSLPKSILLEELNINPLTKKVKEEKVIEYKTQEISITGFSNKSADFNNWLRQLEKEKWVSSVQVVQYNELNAHQKAAFTILIMTT